MNEKKIDPKEAVRISNAALSAAALLKDLAKQASEAGMGDLSYYAKQSSESLINNVVGTPGIKLVVFLVDQEAK